MHALTNTHSSIIHPSQRAKNLLLASVLASIAIAGFVLPVVWNVLTLIDGLPKIAWLQQLLNTAPIFSWILMFAWGACVPLMLLFTMHQAPAHRVRNWVGILVVMLIAVTWFVHMPPAARCDVLYPQAELACSALKWGFSTSLGIATAAYVFVLFVIGFSSVGLFASCIQEKLDATQSDA